MRVCAVVIKDLGLSDLLQGIAGFHHHFDRHLVEDLILGHRVVCKVDDCLHAADARVAVGPGVDRRRNLLHRPPENEDFVVAVTSVLSKLVLVHPVADLLDVVQRKAPLDFGVVAEGRVVELAHGHLVDLLTLPVRQDNVAPHAHLPLSGVEVLLNCVEKGPAVVLRQHTRVNHFRYILRNNFIYK